MKRLLIGLGLLWTGVLLPAQAQVRMIPHVTAPTGSFTTYVHVENNSEKVQACTLLPYSQTGETLTPVVLSLRPFTTFSLNSGVLFNGELVSHFAISANEALVSVAASYEVAAGRGSPAVVKNVTDNAHQWRLYAGDWAEVWDGVAVVNTDIAITQIFIHQVDSSNKILESHLLSPALAPNAKALFVLGGIQQVFTPRSGVHYRISATQNLAVTALRGTHSTPDNGVGLLWENSAYAMPELALHSFADYPIGSAASLFRLNSEPRYGRALTHHFNALTPENEMKMNALQPQQGTFDFSDADTLVTLAQANGMEVHGHTLVWHESLPSWVHGFEGDANAWKALLKDHVQTVANYYKNKVVSWDVVNEIFHDNGTSRETLWLEHLGADYPAQAFRWAHEADPNARLYYNDFNIAGFPDKIASILAMVDDFQSRTPPVPIHGVALQMHVTMEWPPIEAINTALEAMASRGLLVKISELDVRINEDLAYTSFTDELALAHKARIQSIVEAYNRLPTGSKGGITVWGLSDADTWVRYTFNRIDWPLLLDDQYRLKPSFYGFRNGLQVSGKK